MSEANSPPVQGLTRKAVHGTGWSALATTAKQVLSFASVAVLARLLGPSVYGLMGMATLVLAFLTNFRDLGTAAAIIQKPANLQSLTLQSVLGQLRAGDRFVRDRFCGRRPCRSFLSRPENREHSAGHLAVVLHDHHRHRSQCPASQADGFSLDRDFGFYLGCHRLFGIDSVRLCWSWSLEPGDR